jgi:hypothetical protein
VRQICSPIPKSPHLLFIDKLIKWALSQVFSNEPKKFRRWIKKWTKNTLRSSAFRLCWRNALPFTRRSDGVANIGLHSCANSAPVAQPIKQRFRNPSNSPLTSCCPWRMCEHSRHNTAISDAQNVNVASTALGRLVRARGIVQASYCGPRARAEPSHKPKKVI